MKDSFWIQIDCESPLGAERFWMRDLGVAESVASRIAREGWRSLEAPLPLVVAKFCRYFLPQYVELGMTEGFFSLLAAVNGAQGNYHLTVSEQTQLLLTSNFKESGLMAKLNIEIPSSEKQSYPNHELYTKLVESSRDKVVLVNINGRQAYENWLRLNETIQLGLPVICLKVYTSHECDQWREYIKGSGFQPFILLHPGQLEPGIPATIEDEVQSLILLPFGLLDQFTQALQSE